MKFFCSEKSQVLVSGVALWIAVSGCGLKKPLSPVSAARDDLEADLPKHFAKPVENIRFVNNILFFWSDEMDQKEVKAVSAAAAEIARLNAAIGPINQKITSLTAQKEPLQGQITDARVKKIKANSKFQKAKADLKTVQDGIDQIDGELNANPPPTPDHQTELQKKKGELDNQKKADETAVVGAKKELDDAVAALGALSDHIQDLDRQIDALSKQQDENSHRIVDQSEKIKNQVEGFNQNVAFLVQPAADGTLSVSIENWTLEGDGNGTARNFSTSRGADGRATIGNVEYEELGGVLKFEAYVYSTRHPDRTEPRDVYRFTLARVNDDLNDGKIYMAGDVVLLRNTTYGTIERRGVVKLCDHKSN